MENARLSGTSVYYIYIYIYIDIKYIYYICLYIYICAHDTCISYVLYCIILYYMLYYTIYHDILCFITYNFTIINITYVAYIFSFISGAIHTCTAALELEALASTTDSQNDYIIIQNVAMERTIEHKTKQNKTKQKTTATTTTTRAKPSTVPMFSDVGTSATIYIYIYIYIYILEVRFAKKQSPPPGHIIRIKKIDNLASQ